MAVVTVGVPAFRNAGTIRRTIDSIRAQTVGDIRVVLSDDCSDDDTHAICREAAAADARFTAVRQERRRGFLHFGRLLHGVETPFFVWLAGDDWWAPTFLERTVALLRSQPAAVSALPRCAFVDAPEGTRPPRTASLTGPWPRRAADFLACPEGTRMYGLFRTPVLKRSFPDRVMNAFDWYLMLGVLKHGPQIEVPETLLFRERTDWRTYSHVVDEIYPPGVFRRYPVLDMSIAAARAGFVPLTPGVLRRLRRLNLDKRDEYAMVMAPAQFFGELAARAPASLPEAKADLCAHMALSTLREGAADPGLTAAALAALRALAQEGHPSALCNLGRHFAGEGDDPRQAWKQFEAARRLGSAEAELYQIELGIDRGWLLPEEASARLAALAGRGIPRAAVRLAREFCEGSLAGIAPATLGAILERTDDDASGTVTRARARLAALGLGVPRDPDRALRLLAGVAARSPWAAREMGRLLLDLGRPGEARRVLIEAARSGADWSLVDLLSMEGADTDPEIGRLTDETLRNSTDAALCAAVRSRAERRARRTAKATPEGRESAPPTPAAPRAEVSVTAILTARNAETTLGRLLGHFAEQRIPVLFVDHGSEDGTWRIAERARGGPVIGMVREPWLGYFDLTRQLQLKRDLIEHLDCDWVIHADADEFLETASGEPISALLGRYRETRVQAFGCDEFAFLPASEAERHDPDGFPETMRRYVCLRERDPKQRLFRRSAVLDIWMQTGGHTVTRDPRAIAPEPLRLRHYVGLSLDDLRAQYVPRVFGGRDRVKAWHGGRIGRPGDFVRPVPAEPGTGLFDVDRDGWRTDQPHDRLPVLAAPALSDAGAEAPRLPPPEEGGLLVVASADPDAAGWLRRTGLGGLPDLVLWQAGDDVAALMAAGKRPILHVIGLPDAKTETRDTALGWLGSVAAIRQAVLIGERRYAEIRVEECARDASLIEDRIGRLLTSKAAAVLAFPRHDRLPGTRPGPALGRFGASLLRDLGYLGAG